MKTLIVCCIVLVLFAPLIWHYIFKLFSIHKAREQARKNPQDLRTKFVFTNVAEANYIGTLDIGSLTILGRQAKGSVRYHNDRAMLNSDFKKRKEEILKKPLI